MSSYDKEVYEAIGERDSTYIEPEEKEKEKFIPCERIDETESIPYVNKFTLSFRIKQKILRML